MDYFSFSQLNCYTQCGREYYYTYVLGQKKRKSSAMDFGKSIHSSLEKYYDIIKKDPTNTSSAEKSSLKTFIKTFQGTEKDREMGLKLLKGYFKDDNKPYFRPKEVEYKFKTILKHPITGKSLNIPIKGVIDLITEDEFIIDHKTASNAWTMDMVESDMQKIIYWIAYITLFGKSPRGFIHNFLIKRVHEPRYDQQASEVNEAQMVYAIEFIQHIINEIQRKHFPMCQRKYCEYCS